MKVSIKIAFVSFFLTVSCIARAFDVTGEEVSLTGSITSISLTDIGGVINVVSDNDKYGKTWLTYNIKLSNPNTQDQGSFNGRATAINTDGTRASATRQGVWTRNGHIYSFMSLDDVSDGNQYLCITEMNLMTDKVEMRFYPK
jgi:hypothetical protein